MKSSLLVLALLACGLAAKDCAAQQPGTLYVASSGTAAGTGTAGDPFVLVPGREYDLNRLIRRLTDKGQDVEVVFKSGLYRDVRLQILKQGVDTDAIYMLEPGAASDGKQTLVGGKPYHYRSSDRCNAQGMNCRVAPEDYALGPHSAAAVTLRASEPNKAVFDGSAFQAANPEVDSEGIVIGGAYFGVMQAGRQTVASEPIKNVTVADLVFRQYRNGVLIQHALGISILRCTIQDVGTHSAKAVDDEKVGVSGFSANADTRLVLVKGSKILSSWNIAGPTATGKAWPGLMHSIYDGYSADVIFMDNTVTGSSGPMIKLGYYPVKTAGGGTFQYSGDVWNRRGFFIGNRFTLTSSYGGNVTLPTYDAVQAFIHDNSQEQGGQAVSQPAKGMAFLNNTFANDITGPDSGQVAFLRQELPVATMRPAFPAFTFAGNQIDGVQPGRLVVHRVRGTPLAPASVQADPVAGLAGPLAALGQGGASVDAAETVKTLLSTTLRSPDPKRDAAVLAVVETGVMPRMP